MTEETDRKWLERLWAKHGDHVFAYAARRVGASDAEDVVSDVFVVAWRHRSRRPRRELPWLYGVARKVLSDHYRSKQRRGRLLERVGSLPDSQESMPAHLDLLALDSGLDQLSDDDREALLLTAWEGLSPGEAAQVVGVSGAAFRMRLSRARRRFRELLADADEHTDTRRGATS